MVQGLKKQMRWPISKFGGPVYMLNLVEISLPEIAQKICVNAEPSPG
jgi:hypothetical protein